MQEVAERTSVENEECRNQYLTFCIEEDVYAVGVEYVLQIIEMPELVAMPESQPHIRGIFNLRGDVMQALDVHSKFEKGPAEFTDRTCVIIVNTDGLLCGLIVDSIRETLHIAAGDISPPPHLGDVPGCGYITGIAHAGGRMILKVDLQKMLGV